MALKTWYDKDIAHDLSGQRVAILGYGAQGRAQSLNLRDSGVDVVVGLRAHAQSRTRALADGFTPVSLEDAVAGADMIGFLVPDEYHGDVYREHVAGRAKSGACLVFAHGFSVHYRLFEARADLDVVLAAPKGVGFQLRGTYAAGTGVPALIAVAQEATGRARECALAFAAALGCARVGVMETTFKDEAETDLFGEQVVLCGGVPALVQMAFEELVAAGYPEELAYFECSHELKLICDLIYRHGIAGMGEAISNTAEYGGQKTGAQIVNGGTRERMKEALADIRSGAFARALLTESRGGYPSLQRARDAAARDPIEKVGSRLREMMWSGKREA